MSASAGVAFIVSSVTGVFSGRTGATSTATNLPVGSVGSGNAVLVTLAMPTTALPSLEW